MGFLGCHFFISTETGVKLGTSMTMHMIFLLSNIICKMLHELLTHGPRPGGSYHQFQQHTIQGSQIG